MDKYELLEYNGNTYKIPEIWMPSVLVWMDQSDTVKNNDNKFQAWLNTFRQ